MNRARITVVLTAALLIAGASQSASSARAAAPDDNVPLVMPGTAVVTPVTPGHAVGLPDGTAMSLPLDAAEVASATGTTIHYADGLEVFVPSGVTRATPAGYFDPVVTTYSRSQVETVYKAINNIANVCRFLPLPYLASIGCGASPTLSDAFTKAHYQSKRVQSFFYRSKTCSSCSRTDYKVIS